MPAVTIALLCWNQVRFVADALQSIADQSSSDFELIVVDNGSQDNSQRVIVDTLSRLSLDATTIFNPVNLGISGALNQALDVAKGRFFITFASDDVMLPDRVKHQVSKFDALDDSVAILASAFQVSHDGTDTVATRSLGRITSQRSLRRAVLNGRIGNLPGAMFRVSALREAQGFDARCPIEDFDMLVKLVFDLGYGLEADSCVVATYKRHSSNISRNNSVMAAGISYTVARLLQSDLTRKERRLAQGAVWRQLVPHWRNLIHTLGEGQYDRLRQHAMRAIFQQGLTPSQRLKCLGVLMMPSKAVSRVRG